MEKVYKGLPGSKLPDRDGNRPVRQDVVLGDLRDAIVAGRLAPGDRLPSHHALMRDYGLSLTTVQRALRRLREEGFIRTVPGGGRFVVDHPPHRHQYALVFPGHPQRIRSHHWSRLLEALWLEAQRHNEAATGELGQWVPYFDVWPDRDGRPGAGYEALVNDIAANRLAGVYFAATPMVQHHAELLRDCHLPLALPNGPRDGRGALIWRDRDEAYRRAIRLLLEQGRSKIAWLTIPSQPAHDLRAMISQVQHVGHFESPARWIASASPYHHDWLAQHIRGLVDAADDMRPDALVICDDHLVEPACDALASLNVRVPEDLAIAGVWNYPIAPRPSLPVTLLGFDARQQLDAAMHALAQARQHGEPRTSEDQFTHIPPRTLEEFHAAGGHLIEPNAERLSANTSTFFERALA